MFDEPSDVSGECNARLFIADNYGDGTATMRCQLTHDHEGVHKEQFERKGGLVTITWIADERERCDHGCGQWRHAHDDENVVCPRDADDHEFSDCAYCHPDQEGKTCAACGKTYYYEDGHKCHCQTGTDRPENIVACPVCEKGPGVPCDGPSSHDARIKVYDVQRATSPEDDEFAVDDALLNNPGGHP